MTFEIVMPRMGLTMEEGTIVSWLKEVGEKVKTGEPLLEIETDKATVEIEAPRDGVVSQILAKKGATLPVGTVIGYLTSEKEFLPTQKKLAPQETTSGKQALPAPTPVLLPTSRDETSKVRASPAARKLARQTGVDLSQVQGSGPSGRVVAWNIEAMKKKPDIAADTPAGTPQATPIAHKAASELGVDLAVVRGSGPGGRVTREDVERAALANAVSQPIPAKPSASPTPSAALGPVRPLSRMHKIMAERMVNSFTHAPHFYLHVEADARPLVQLRQALLPKLEERAGVHLTITDLLVKLTAFILEKHRHIIAQWAGDGLRQPEHINIGVASDTPTGLIVPVIKECERLSLVEIARRRTELVEKAHTGKLSPEDLELGVFTLTNLGTFNIDFFDAILNPPQAAILAVGRIKERPFTENGRVIAAQTLTLSLSGDHRVFDGAAGARFLGDLVELIENPGLTLG